MIRNEQEFFSIFDMQVRVSDRRLRRIDKSLYKANAWNYQISDSAMYQYTATQAIEEVECVDITMPRDRLGHLVAYVQETSAEHERIKTDRQLIAQYERDRSVRLQYPAVEKAYQKYVTMLELCRK